MRAVYLEQQHLAQMACFYVLLSVSRSEGFFFLKEILIFKRKNDIGQNKGYLKICNDIHVLKISYVMQVLISQLSRFATTCNNMK